MKAFSIGVISDTHYPDYGDLPLDAIQERFSGVELILHAGDLVAPDVLKLLQRIAPVEAVAGNMDYPVTRVLLPERKVVVREGLAFGLVHRFPVTDDPQSLISSLFPGQNLNAVIFGHTHVPFNQTIGKILLFNPGSAVRPYRGQAPSVGILKVTAECRIEGSIVPL